MDFSYSTFSFELTVVLIRESCIEYAKSNDLGFNAKPNWQPVRCVSQTTLSEHLGFVVREYCCGTWLVPPSNSTSVESRRMMGCVNSHFNKFITPYSLRTTGPE